MQTEQTRHLIASSKGGQGVCPNKKKALDPLKCSCASDTTRDENWWQNLCIRVSMCKKVSFFLKRRWSPQSCNFLLALQLGPMFSMKCSKAYNHRSLLLATDLDNCHDIYSLLSIPISVHSIVPSFKTNSCCCCTRFRIEGSLVSKSKNWLAQHKLANICMWD